MSIVSNLTELRNQVQLLAPRFAERGFDLIGAIRDQAETGIPDANFLIGVKRNGQRHGLRVVLPIDSLDLENNIRDGLIALRNYTR